MYIITASWMISGEVLNYRNGLRFVVYLAKRPSFPARVNLPRQCPKKSFSDTAELDGHTHGLFAILSLRQCDPALAIDKV